MSVSLSHAHAQRCGKHRRATNFGFPKRLNDLFYKLKLVILTRKWISALFARPANRLGFFFLSWVCDDVYFFLQHIFITYNFIFFLLIPKFWGFCCFVNCTHKNRKFFFQFFFFGGHISSASARHLFFCVLCFQRYFQSENSGFKHNFILIFFNQECGNLFVSRAHTKPLQYCTHLRAAPKKKRLKRCAFLVQ